MTTEQPSMAVPDDAPGLAAEARLGDAGAFCRLCRPLEERLFRQALSLCGEPAAAEDLAQEVLLEAWKSISRYNGRCQFFTWLCAILLHRYQNSVRTRRPVPLSALKGLDLMGAEHILSNQVDPGASPDEASRLAERSRFLRGCIERLSAKHRVIVYMRFYSDDSLEGIAVALDCSLGTVKSRLFYALEKLRAMSQADGNRENWSVEP